MKEYQDFIQSTGYGHIQGLCGVNCRHTFYQFLPNINTEPTEDIDYEENQKYYELSQKQRSMERQIRENKRKLFALKESGIDTEESKQAKKRLREKLTAQSDKYNQFCEDNNLSRQNWRLKV